MALASVTVLVRLGWDGVEMEVEMVVMVMAMEKLIENV